MSTNTEVRPFTIQTSDADLEDLHARVVATRWPEKEPVKDQSEGVSLKTAQQLASYWADGYDWRKCETKLNALPQFITEIDGLDIHFLHIRSKHDNAMPLIVSHGWPGSVLEQMKIIEPLTDPTAHGGSASDAFDLVIPSMPGYGYSSKPTEPGWGPDHIGRAWVELMKRLGYSRIRRPGRRLGRDRGGPDGRVPATGIARNPHQHGRHSSARHRQPVPEEPPRSGQRAGEPAG